MPIEMRDIRGRFRRDCPNRDLRCVLYKVPSALQLGVAFQQEQAGGHYIVREKMDDAPFSGQYLRTLLGETARSAEEIRAETLSYQEQILRYHERHRDRMVVAFAGAGNITMNPRFMAYADGRLASTEIDQKRYFGKPAPAFVVSNTGKTRFRYAVSFSLVRNKPVLQVGGKVCTRGTACAIQGPCLVRNGDPINAADLSTMAQDEWFYDLRHIIQFPYVSWPAGHPNPLRIDVGLEALWEDVSGVRELNKDRVAGALAGDVIKIDLRPYVDTIYPYSQKYGGVVGIDAVRNALDTQSYSTNGGKQHRGWYRIDRSAKKLHIRFHEGTYNHSILGLTKGDAEIRWLGLAGLGGRVGLTMVDAANLAAENGLHNALLIDNGGDVMFNYRGEWVIRSGYDRTRIRGLLLFTAKTGDSPPRQDWLPLDPI